ncbi:MAG: hypothetical protein JJE16_02135 [Nitrospiraceae bacterium]|nr:hypothetical protein [Nitrospiraceae bacterium]
MAAISDAAWIEANVEVVDKYLKHEFENFAIVHRAYNSRTHTFTVDNGKKRFTLLIEWPIFAEKRESPASIGRGLKKEHVAVEMRLHREDGYFWIPSQEDTIQRSDM